MTRCAAPVPPDVPILLGDRLMASETATAAAGAAIARLAVQGDIFALWGGLGSGKTVFARGFIRAWLGASTEVPSPTFTLVQVYDAPEPLAAPIYHFDLFRLRTAEEAVELGLEEARAMGIALIEWPDRLGESLPADRLDVIFSDGDTAETRRLTLAGPDSWRRRFGEVGPCLI